MTTGSINQVARDEARHRTQDHRQRRQRPKMPPVPRPAFRICAARRRRAPQSEHHDHATPRQRKLAGGAPRLKYMRARTHPRSRSHARRRRRVLACRTPERRHHTPSPGGASSDHSNGAPSPMLVRRGAATPDKCTSTRQDRTRHGSNGKAAERTGGHEPARTRPKTHVHAASPARPLAPHV